MTTNESIYDFFEGFSIKTLIRISEKPVTELSLRQFTLSELTYNETLGYFFEGEKNNEFSIIGYHLQKYNKTKYRKNPSPKLHLVECETKLEFHNNMIFTNSMEATYFDTSKNHTVPIKEKLKICENCKKMITNITSIRLTGESFENYILALEENDKTKCKIVGYDGYTTNWKQVSKAFREVKGYKCEKCPYKLPEYGNAAFIHTHHQDGNKLNNKKSNLQCLCIKCHSEVDDLHRENFSNFLQQQMLKDFEDYKKNQ